MYNSGPIDSETDFSLYRWSGQNNDTPSFIRSLNTGLPRFAPEAIISFSDQSNILLLSDDGTIQVKIKSPQDCVDEDKFYCFNDLGQVASVTEIEKSPRFYFENFAPECGTNPVKGPDDHQGWRQASDNPVHYQRTLANGWDSFKAPNSITGGNLYAQWGQRFVLNLRPDEYYTRYFHHLDGSLPVERTFRPLKNGTDVENQHGHRGIRANGFWRYAPDLRSEHAAELVYDAHNVTWGDARKGFAVRVAQRCLTFFVVKPSHLQGNPYH